ncbi:hypothetical protein EJ357_22685 [Streptomyces cyaneochromogenes]|uniref:Uncharacterized protein n=1 Tax=Streptomyces cyaneochromogenes TaxID=2496836 RepID=A0A3Q9EU22_9ACTN|nr:hypothetical protein [Streptomyces cyaneochromogenes]AZQ35940.1 hypothetical protein EJ357_22685 [Streptomyces cyaneochromogenes]
MTDYDHTFSHAGRSAIRVKLTRAHLPAALAKLLDKLETATAKVDEAKEAERTCGHGTGPELAAFQKKTRAAQDAERDALDVLLGASLKHRGALLDSSAAGFDDALERATRAKAELLAALEEATEAAALYACAQDSRAVLDVDDRTTARKHPARNAASFAASYVRETVLPTLYAERAA